jgi:signal transduction histidine kinase
VATAGGERDRELRAKWRLALTVVLPSGLVLLFGGVALRRQRRQLELARELSMAELIRERDERLVRADKLATLGALATGIAHEVSTPLGVIIGRAEQVLPRVSQDERTQRAVQAIIDRGNRINQVVRGMLALARGLAPTLEHVEPSRVARAACELVQHRFTNAGVELKLEVQPQLPAIACEPRLFEQVLVNLLLNACDACHSSGHVQLEVHAEAERVAFTVLDDGAGISPLAAARATEPFFTTKSRDQGTGLGLAIANEIVKHHNGSLSIGPREDRAGTRAAVSLPSVKA